MVLCAEKPAVFFDVVVSNVKKDHGNEGRDMHTLQHDRLWCALDEVDVRAAQLTCPVHAEIRSGHQTFGATEGPYLA